MKKRYLAAGILSSFFAGAAVYKKLKDKQDNNILMYPVCRVTMHSDTRLFKIEELIEGAELIAHCNVQEINKPRWNNKENKQPSNIDGEDVIYTDYILKPNKILKGMFFSEETFKLRAYEGTVNGFTIEDNTQPVLHVGDAITVFLTKDKSHFNKKTLMDHYAVFGDNQGVFVHSDSKVISSRQELDIIEFNTLLQFGLKEEK
jgi:hypothetical protein